METQKRSFIRIVVTLFVLVVLCCIAMSMVYVLKSWGPMDANVNTRWHGVNLAATGLVGGVIIILLVLVFALGKLLQMVPLGAQLAQKFMDVRAFGLLRKPS